MPPNSNSTSLDALKAKLRERLQVDVSKLHPFEHQGSGVTFLPRPMAREGYDAVDNAVILPEESDHWPEGEKRKFIRYNTDKAYLRYGVLLEDGSPVDDETVELLLQGAWDGDNRSLLDKVRKLNPPRELLREDMAAILAVNRMALVLLRILARAGLLVKARDYLLAEPESEESAALAEDLRKWEETMPVWEAALDTDRAARSFGIGVYERDGGKKATSAI